MTPKRKRSVVKFIENCQSWLVQQSAVDVDVVLILRIFRVIVLSNCSSVCFNGMYFFVFFVFLLYFDELKFTYEQTKTTIFGITMPTKRSSL